MLRLKVISLGCSKNTVDTEHLLAQLPSDRFCILDEQASSGSDASQATDSLNEADILLINTCGFIGDAKEESVEVILSAVRAKQEGRIGKIVVFGCLSQRYAKELALEIPEVDAWFGARDLSPLLSYLGVKASPYTTRYRSTHKGYAYLKISEGCDRRCSYCAIPYIRGAHRSVPIEDLVAEAKGLAEQGVHELILIAQDTTYYGLDLYGSRALAELTDRLSELPGIEWIRLHYSYPADFPMDVLDRMANNPKICKYLDIPLQHISDLVLDKMHRHTSGAWTRELISQLRSRVPGVVLRTTMIVGHPGETETEFSELMDFVQEARFERLGAFCYSEEEGTYGEKHFKDNIPSEVKSARYDALMSAQREISLAFNQSRVGSVEKVMVDAVAGDYLVCRSQYESPDVDGEILVRGWDGPAPIGDFIYVKIVSADEYDLEGKP